MKSILAMFSVLLLVLVSCISPLTKEAYLTQYENFVSNVKENRNTQGFKWDKYDKEFEKFSQTFYQRFESELTWAEKIVCKRFEVEYLIMRTQDEASILKSLVINDLRHFQNCLDSYIDNQLEQDIQLLIDEASGIKDLVFKTLNQTLENIKTDGSSTTP